MEDGNLAVLVDAKTEYTKQLVNTLKQNMYQGIKNIFYEARDTCNSLDKPNETSISNKLHIFLSRISTKLISYGFYKILILIGGDTAHTVLQTASIKEIDVVEEILPGTAVSLPLMQNNKFKIITKSGGFGDEQHISDLISKLL